MMKFFLVGVATGSILTIAVFQIGSRLIPSPTAGSHLADLDFPYSIPTWRLSDQVDRLRKESVALQAELLLAKQASPVTPTAVIRWRTRPVTVPSPVPDAEDGSRPPAQSLASECLLNAGDQIELEARAVELQELQGATSWAAVLSVTRVGPGPRRLIGEGRVSGMASESWRQAREEPKSPAQSLGLGFWGSPSGWALGPLLELPAGSWRSYRARVLVGGGVGLGGSAGTWVASLGLLVGR